MKRILKYALMCLAVSAMAACSKIADDNASESGPVVNPTGNVSITATVPSAFTKVDLIQDSNDPDGKIHLKWHSGDVITVKDASDASKSVTFTLSTGEGEATAVFTASDASALSGSTSFIISYSNLGSYSEQTQASDGDTGHLKYGVTLSGVNTYDDIIFSQDWATSNGGGTCTQSSVLRLRAQLPSGVAASVQAVTFKADQDIFDGGKTLKVNITTPGDADSDNILNVFASLPGGVVIPAGTNLLFQFQISANAYDKYTAHRLISAETNFYAGQVNAFKINCPNIASYANAGNTDIGTSTNPYLIGDQHQMEAMNATLVNGSTKYCKLVDDIDMTSVNWTPANATAVSGKFDKGIYFDGNNKTISNFTCKNVAYPSLFGVLHGTVKNLVVDSADIDGSKAAGVIAGFVGSSSGAAGCLSGVTVKNSTVKGSAQKLGGMAGYVNVAGTEGISDCIVMNTTVTSSVDRVGGLFGQVDAGISVKDCAATDVTVKGGTINIGGLVGVGYGSFDGCCSSGTISSSNTTSNTDIALGGLVGYFEKGVISNCHSSVNVSQTTNGRDIGGLVGKMLAATVRTSYSTGNVSGIQRNVGGFVGLVSLTSGTATIENCYCTGNVDGDAYSGGFLGLHEKGTCSISNCYSSGTSSGGFALGGMIGYAGAAALTMANCAAWGASVTASSSGSGNWSSAALVGVAFPTCTLTDNYRNPDMALTVYWVPADDYQHANVSSSHPLVTQDGTESTATSVASGQPGYPQFPYHGKVDADKTLSQLASTTLGWNSTIWDFTGNLPVLK